MKDVPHHIKKLNRRVVRSMHREEMDEERLPDVPTMPETERQIKKKAKHRQKKKRKARAPTPSTPEERNKEMKKRSPVFEPDSHYIPPTATRNQKKPRRI